MAGRVHELRAVVLADVEGVDPDRLGEHRLLDGVADHLVAADRLPRRVDRHGQEGVESEFECRGQFLSLSSAYLTAQTYGYQQLFRWGVTA